MSSIISGESDSKWSKHLPSEIIETILLKRLCLPDLLRCGAVCQTWRDVVANAILNKLFDPKSQLPWIMLPESSFQKKLSSKFFSLNEDRTYEINIPKNDLLESGFIVCLGSIKGWLIMRDVLQGRMTYYFLNPLSGVGVQLPIKFTSISLEEAKHFEKVVASSIPTCSNCIVAGFLQGGKLAFCKPNDKTWTFMKRHSAYRFVAIEFHEDGNLYALADDINYMNIIIFDPQEVLSDRNRDRYRGKKLVLLHPVPALETPSYYPKLQIKTFEHPYLVKSSGSQCELLLVLRCFERKFNDRFRTTGFRVFKLEKSGPCWVEIKTLEDQILFLNDGGGFSISNLTTPLTNKSPGTRNCIYCVNKTCYHFEVMVYWLASGRIKYLFNSSKRWGPVWFTPNPW